MDLAMAIMGVIEIGMDKTEQIYRSKKKMLLNNFLGGIAWGLGASLGVSVILAFVGFVLGNIDFVPLVGDFLTDLGRYIDQNSSLPGE